MILHMLSERHCDTAWRGIRAHYAQMAAVEVPGDDVLSQVARALAMLERVRVRWRRYPDTTPLASTAEPVEVSLRSAKAAFAEGGGSRDREAIEALPRALIALRVMKREELMTVIESVQAAYDAASSRNFRSYKSV